MKKITTILSMLILMTISTLSYADNNANADASTFSNARQGQSTSIDSHDRAVSNGSDLGKMVPAAVAPALTTTLTETCMGSTSAGVSWAGAGISFGTTWRDSACVRRLDAREVKTINVPGANWASKEIMCDSDLVREAFQRAGFPCAVDGGKPVMKTVMAPAPAPRVNREVNKKLDRLFEKEMIK